MTARLLRVFLVSGFVLALMGAVLIGGSATAVGNPTCLYFPWAPNQVDIYDPVTEQTSGPYRSETVIQNLEDESITVYFLEYDNCDFVDPGDAPSVIMAARRTTSFSSDYSGYIDVGAGGGLVIAARKTANLSEPARIAGGLRQASPVSFHGHGGTMSNHDTVSGYTALTTSDLGTNVFLPIAQTNSNWNTLIRATNFSHNLSGSLTLELYEAKTGDSPGGPFVAPVIPGETITWDLRDLGIPDGWVGSARIHGMPRTGAVAERIKVETNMLLMNTSQMEMEFTETGFAAAPLIFQNWHHWNTGLSVANFWATQNEVNVYFYDMNGVLVHSETTTLPPNGMDFFYLPAGDGEPFIGSAIILGTKPLYGAVDEVKYFGGDLDTGHAMSYMLERIAAPPGQSLAFPFFAKGDAQSASHDTSGIQVFNPFPNTSEVEVMIYDQNGNPMLAQPDSFSLGWGESRTVYSLDYVEIPLGGVGFVGSAVVDHVSAAGVGPAGITAISNVVNYDVNFDGSGTFNQIRFTTEAGDDDDDWDPPIIILLDRSE